MRFASAIIVAALMVAGRADAQQDERKPARARLRLDESPDLALLAPFRHASDPDRRAVSRWRNSPWGDWVRRNMHFFDWEAGYAARSHGTEAPISPNVGLGGGQPCEARLSETAPRWPYVAPREHWFEDEAQMPWPTEPVTLSADVLPPWLARVDVHWAHALLLAAGCGRGGTCSVGESFPASAFVDVWNALSPEVPPPPWWECRERPLRLHRFGQEKETFTVLNCDGSIPPGALETLSVLARPPNIARPDELPVEASAGKAEWMVGIRVMHPRLLWVLHRVALAFPWRAVHLYSGYRPADRPLKPGTHSSNHAFGRALDIRVQGIDNEELLALCHKLADIGCGYYPNGKFVHFDIRYRGSGLWVDASAPGEPSRYVDGWPGVVENARVVWNKPE
jgi:hypothetical protein